MLEELNGICVYVKQTKKQHQENRTRGRYGVGVGTRGGERGPEVHEVRSCVCLCVRKNSCVG